MTLFIVLTCLPPRVRFAIACPSRSLLRSAKGTTGEGMAVQNLECGKFGHRRSWRTGENEVRDTTFEFADRTHELAPFFS
jgi:hypothetical protein